jgi:hypothetical protein
VGEQSSDTSILVGGANITPKIPLRAWRIKKRGRKKGRVYAKITEADIIRPPAMKVDFPNLSDSIPQIISKNSIPSVDTKARIPQSKTDTPTDVKNNGTMLSNPNITPRKKTIRYAKRKQLIVLAHV